MPDASDDLGDTIADAAQGPSSVTSDGHSVSARPLAELIEADRYLRNKEAAERAPRGIRITKLLPPGAA
jgi:hypothetical protein